MRVSLTGNDTIQINGQTLADFADGDTAVLEFGSDIATVKTGKDGNSIYALNNTGRQCTLTLRLLRAGSDDAFLLSLFNGYLNNPAGFTLLDGEFIKNIGDGQGNIAQDIYQMSGGLIKKGQGVKENADGTADQAIVVYEILFTNAPRSLT